MELKPKQTVHHDSECPVCGVKMNLALRFDGPEIGTRDPEPNDIALCGDCRSVLIFTDDLKLKAIDLEYLSKLDEETRKIVYELRDHYAGGSAWD